MRVLKRLVLSALAVLTMFAERVIAADYPTKPIRAIVPFAAGGVTDIVSRIVFEQLSRSIGQQIVIENRPNAAGTTAVEAAARSSPDGYTLVVADPYGSLAANVTLYPRLGYDPGRDLAPVAMLGTTGAVVAVSGRLAAATMSEFVTLARSKPGKLHFASTGGGTPGHLNGELFKRQVGIDAVHVPYRVVTQGMMDLVTGRVDFWIGPIPAFLSYIQAGQIRALAVAGESRWPDLPGVPTVKESGFGEYDASTSYAVFVPAGTPQGIVEELHGQLRSVLDDDDVKRRLRMAGVIAQVGDASAVGVILRSRTLQWRQVIEAAKIAINDR